MDSTDSIRLLAASVAPLAERFGSGLTLVREWNCVQWTYRSQSAIVEFVPGDTLQATFIAAPVIDEVTQRPVCAVYESKAERYRLTELGGRAMVADMLAFFSGEREPRFAFARAYEPTAQGAEPMRR